MTNVVAACRDVDPARLEALMPDVQITPVYPGSAKGNCQSCAVEVWVGPRAQQAIERNAAIQVVCFICAAAGGGLAVNLGNPYKPRKP